MFASSAAHADWLHKLVGYACKPENDWLAVTYRRVYNQAGEEMLINKGPDAWNPWDLLEVGEETSPDGARQKVIVGTKSIERTCKLAHGDYTVVIRAQAGNRNPQGRCGAVVAAVATIRKGDVTLFDRALEGDCHNSIEASIDAIVIHRGEARIERGDKYEILK
jgi:hypothetical protein